MSSPREPAIAARRQLELSSRQLVDVSHQTVCFAFRRIRRPSPCSNELSFVPQDQHRVSAEPEDFQTK